MSSSGGSKRRRLYDKSACKRLLAEVVQTAVLHRNVASLECCGPGCWSRAIRSFLPCHLSETAASVEQPPQLSSYRGNCIGLKRRSPSPFRSSTADYECRLTLSTIYKILHWNQTSEPCSKFARNRASSFVRLAICMCSDVRLSCYTRPEPGALRRLPDLISFSLFLCRLFALLSCTGAVEVGHVAVQASGETRTQAGFGKLCRVRACGAL